MALTKVPTQMMGAGAVLQVVQGTLVPPAVSTSSSTFSDTNLTATITPTSSTSKILVTVQHFGCGKGTGNTGLNLRLQRNGTTIQNIVDAAFYNGTTAESRFNVVSGCYLDSPATTSAVVYKTQFANYINGTGTVWVSDYGNVNPTATITLMEIAA